MNGVHCQTSDAMIASFGQLEIQSGCGGVVSPNSFQTQVMTPLNSP